MESTKNQNTAIDSTINSTRLQINLDLTKQVKFKNPQTGEENLIFKIVNYNKVTNRCYIESINLSGFNAALLPQTLISSDDIENV
jgi:hypothetical protein